MKTFLKIVFFHDENFPKLCFCNFIPKFFIHKFFFNEDWSTVGLHCKVWNISVAKKLFVIYCKLSLTVWVLFLILIYWHPHEAKIPWYFIVIASSVTSASIWPLPHRQICNICKWTKKSTLFLLLSLSTLPLSGKWGDFVDYILFTVNELFFV